MKVDALKKIKIYMIKKDLGNSEAADQLGMHVNYFRSILNGSKTPGRNAAVKIEGWTNGEIKAYELMGF